MWYVESLGSGATFDLLQGLILQKVTAGNWIEATLFTEADVMKGNCQEILNIYRVFSNFRPVVGTHITKCNSRELHRGNSFHRGRRHGWILFEYNIFFMEEIYKITSADSKHSQPYHSGDKNKECIHTDIQGTFAFKNNGQIIKFHFPPIEIFVSYFQIKHMLVQRVIS